MESRNTNNSVVPRKNPPSERYPQITVMGKLIIKSTNAHVGYRVTINNKPFDISISDLNLIVADLNPIVHKAPTDDIYLLVERGTSLEHENPRSDAPEVTYGRYMTFCGLLGFEKMDTRLKTLYNEWNQKAFDGKLPTKVLVVWSNRVKVGGRCQRFSNPTPGNPRFVITLSLPYHKLNPQEVLDTLVHEMIHVAYFDASHGPIFHRETARINAQHGLNLGVYAEGKVDYKYVYECVDCGKDYKRHRRLPTGNVCGVCRGKLYLAIDNS